MTTPAPCSDEPDLFRSTRRADHEDARMVCLKCPLAHQCRQLARSDRHANGTYGGNLYKRGQLVQLETLAGVADLWVVGAHG